jgi:hypothetical protein
VRIRSKRTLAAFTTTAVLAAGFCSGAQAAEFQQAKFKAEVKGVQTYANEYHHVSTDRCDPQIDSSNYEVVRFKSTKPVLLTATKVSGLKDPLLTSGTKPLALPTRAKVTRSNSNSYTQVPEDCSGNGGGVGPGPAPDCGTKTVSPWLLSLDYWKRDHLELQPENGPETDLFQNCGRGEFPYLLEGLTFGKRQSAKLPAKELFDQKIGKLITIGTGNRYLPMPEGFDETTIRWELSLTRVGK